MWFSLIIEHTFWICCGVDWTISCGGFMDFITYLLVMFYGLSCRRYFFVCARWRNQEFTKKRRNKLKQNHNASIDSSFKVNFYLILRLSGGCIQINKFIIYNENVISQMTLTKCLQSYKNSSYFLLVVVELYPLRFTSIEFAAKCKFPNSNK